MNENQQLSVHNTAFDQSHFWSDENNYLPFPTSCGWITPLLHCSILETFSKDNLPVLIYTRWKTLFCSISTTDKTDNNGLNL
jgi:hypothetical protein